MYCINFSFHFQVGFGKGTVSKVLWIDCIDHSVTEHQLEKYFAKYGRVTRIGYDHYGGTAIVQFDTIEEAKEALVKVKGTTIGTSGRKIMVPDKAYSKHVHIQYLHVQVAYKFVLTFTCTIYEL